MIADGNPLISWSYLQQNYGTFLSQLGMQAELSAIAVAVGSAISLPLALAVRRNRRARAVVLGIAGVFYTIPSLALFALVQPIVGYFSVTSAEVALVSYTLLVLVRNVLAGLDGVPAEVREAAQAAGYRPFGSLLKVELPLALPAIFAGLRVATVTVIGLVTVTTFIGINVLGQSIVMGFQDDFNTPIVVALVLSVLLAGLADLWFGHDRAFRCPVVTSTSARGLTGAGMHFWSLLWSFFTTASNWRGDDGIADRLLLQVELSAIVLVISGLIGVGLGFALGYFGRGGLVAVNAANAARAVPSLALLTLLAIWPVVGLRFGGMLTASITLAALAIPPILTNAYVGIREVDPDIREAALAAGMGRWRRFWQAEVPLALPLAFAGLRTAAVEVVATSTLAAYVTVNDLGEYIFAGLSTQNTVETVGGAILVALLSLLADGLVLLISRALIPAPLRPRVGRDRLAGRVGVRGLAGSVR